jgi:hypothetical protein
MWYLFHVHNMHLRSRSRCTLLCFCAPVAHSHAVRVKHNFALRKQLLCCRFNYLYKTIAETQQELQNYVSRDDGFIKLFPLESRFPFSPLFCAMLLPQWVKVNALTFSLFLGIFYNIFIMCLVVARYRRRQRHADALNVYLEPLLKRKSTS